MKSRYFKGCDKFSTIKHAQKEALDCVRNCCANDASNRIIFGRERMKAKQKQTKKIKTKANQFQRHDCRELRKKDKKSFSFLMSLDFND